MPRIIFCLLAISAFFSSNAQVYSLSSEYYDVCLRSTSQWSLSASKAEEGLTQIYAELNFSGYKIEVVKCDKIKTSALAILYQGERYILINEGELTDLNTRYFSHLFVIAHEFAHHYLNHFGSQVIPTNENKRRLELAADQYAASLVRKLGGKIDDCYYALDRMRHPLDPMYSDHPSKEARRSAVAKGFPVIVNPVIINNYVDYASSSETVALLKYSGGVNSTDITDYRSKTNMFPVSIFNYNSATYIYWSYMEDVVNYTMFWNQSTYPDEKIKKYLEKDFNIEFIEKIDGKWFVVMLKYKEQFRQTLYYIKKTDLQRKQGDYQEYVNFINTGYAIQNIISYDDDNYVLLLTGQPVSRKKCAFFNLFDSFQTWLNSNTDLNHLYCYKYIDGKYFGFLQDTPGLTSWQIEFFNGSRTGFQTILQRINNGYAVENIVMEPQVTFVLVKY
jgi:hypothetical protein